MDNVPSLLEHGIVANTDLTVPLNTRRSIAERDIQTRRATMPVPCGPGGVVHDYVPLYFGSVSPMLLRVINQRNVDQSDIVYIEFPIELVTRDDTVFTNASANTVVAPEFFSDPDDLDQLNWQEIDSRKWRPETGELRHQRMAEVLVHQRLDIADATRITVWNETTRTQLKEMARRVGFRLPSIEFESIDRSHYFTKFMEGKPDVSLVTGPRGIRVAYEEAVEAIRSAPAPKPAKFRNRRELLDAVRQNFGCTPWTGVLVGLQSANPVHPETVDEHTRTVVERLRALPKYRALPSDGDRGIVELAAYLHDIGKGPKARWKATGGLQQVDPDHPVRAMPMMVELMTTQVGNRGGGRVGQLLKLVCYHDLVGDVIGKGRDERQIVEIADGKSDLDLLFMLGKADATSLREYWWQEPAARSIYKRCLDLIQQPR